MKRVIHLHEDYHRPEWEEWMEALPRLVAKLPDSQLIQTGRNRVHWVEHEGRKLVVKHFLNTGPWKKTVYRICSGKARRSFEHSMALIDAGLLSPQPVGWREDWAGGFLQESFYISAHVEVAHSAKVIRQRNGTDWTASAVSVAEAIGRMHEAGLLHHDLSAGNFLFVGPNGKERSLYVIDNNRMSFGQVDMRRGIKSLLQPKVEGEYLKPYVTAYARARGFDPDACVELYEKLMGGHKLKWKIKNLTRPWRRKIGL